MNRYYEELQTRLKKRRSDGWTNQRMAELGDTSQAHINRLLNMVERATDAECEKMLAALEKAGEGDCGGDKPGED